MNECARMAALLDVYLDDQTTAETNALVQSHIAQCRACARRLDRLRAHRSIVRSAMRERVATVDLHNRIHAVMRDEPRPALAALIRTWVVPAMATALVAWIVIPWQANESDTYALAAVGEHRACALDRAITPRADSYYRPSDWMPLVPNLGGRIRVLEAHACGQHSDYTHVIVEADDGRKGSILISRAPEGAERTLRAEQRGEFEVTQVRTTRHRAFVVVDRQPPPAFREWRQPAIARLHHFLKQMEEM